MTASTQFQTNPILAPDIAAQQQELLNRSAIANALLQEGLAPINTNNRQIGGVGYAISPWEGVAKLVEALSGRIGQDQVASEQSELNKKYAQALIGNGDLSQSDNSPQSGYGSGNYGSNSQQSIMSPYEFARMQALYGTDAATKILEDRAHQTDLQKNASDPRFGGQVVNEQYYKGNPGAAKMQEILGTNYAGALPYGTPPQGMGGGAQMPQIPPVNASALMPPQVSGGYRQSLPIPPNPQQQPQYVAGNANFAAPPNPQGMTADEYKAALSAKQAGMTKQAEMTPQLVQIYNEMGSRAQDVQNMLKTADAIETGNYYQGNTGQIRDDVANALSGLGIAPSSLQDAASRTEALKSIYAKAFLDWKGAEQAGGTGGIQVRNQKEFDAVQNAFANLNQLEGGRNIIKQLLINETGKALDAQNLINSMPDNAPVDRSFYRNLGNAYSKYLPVDTEKVNSILASSSGKGQGNISQPVIIRFDSSGKRVQ